MNNFTASNGIIVDRVGADDEWTVDPLGKHARVSRAQMNALREFFQAETDERLGRWRWPDNPNFVVYPPRPGFSAPDGCDVFVMNELWGSALGYVDSEFASYDEEDIPFAAAGRAYFDAHPEPKPWHDASLGEFWELRKRDEEPALYVVENSGKRFIHVERRLLALDIGDPDIVSGRRIWPEVSS